MPVPTVRPVAIIAAALITSTTIAAQESSDKHLMTPKLHMLVEGNRGPVVILEAGFASDSTEWRSVQPRLANFSRVASYDRAGLGQSPAGALPRTAKQIASDLHRALRGAGLEPPYVLVAHSAGALYIREFAHVYPADVMGMVFADPAPPRFYQWFRQHSPEAWNAMVREVATSSKGAKQELVSLDTSIAQASAAWPLPGIPVYLLVATRLQPPFKGKEGLKVWISMQQDFCRRLSDCILIRDSKSGHDMPMDDPSLIVSSVRKVIADALGDRSLHR